MTLKAINEWLIIVGKGVAYRNPGVRAHGTKRAHVLGFGGDSKAGQAQGKSAKQGDEAQRRSTGHLHDLC